MSQASQLVTPPVVSEELNRPDVFKFMNFREFIKAHYLWKKSLHSTYSYKVLSRMVGVSGSYLRMVVQGERNLPDAKASLVAKACGLNSWEEEYFVNLAQWNQTRNEVLKQNYWEKLLKLAPSDKLTLAEGDEEVIVSEWFVVALLEMFRLKDFSLDPKWISKRFAFQISEETIADVLQKLRAVGILSIEDGKTVVKKENLIACSSRVSKEKVRDYHRENIPKGVEAIDRIESSLRQIISASLAVSDQDVKRLCERIEEFRDEVLEEAAQAQKMDQVYQLNIQFFPMTKSGGAK